MGVVIGVEWVVRVHAVRLAHVGWRTMGRWRWRPVSAVWPVKWRWGSVGVGVVALAVVFGRVEWTVFTGKLLRRLVARLRFAVVGEERLVALRRATARKDVDFLVGERVGTHGGHKKSGVDAKQRAGTEAVLYAGI